MGKSFRTFRAWSTKSSKRGEGGEFLELPGHSLLPAQAPSNLLCNSPSLPGRERVSFIYTADQAS